jgi:hypothetical protein
MVLKLDKNLDIHHVIHVLNISVFIKRHDIAEILQTLTLNTNQSISLIIEITCRFV